MQLLVVPTCSTCTNQNSNLDSRMIADPVNQKTPAEFRSTRPRAELPDWRFRSRPFVHLARARMWQRIFENLLEILDAIPSLETFAPPPPRATIRRQARQRKGHACASFSRVHISLSLSTRVRGACIQLRTSRSSSNSPQSAVDFAQSLRLPGQSVSPANEHTHSATPCC